MKVSLQRPDHLIFKISVLGISLIMSFVSVVTGSTIQDNPKLELHNCDNFDLLCRSWDSVVAFITLVNDGQGFDLECNSEYFDTFCIAMQRTVDMHKWFLFGTPILFLLLNIVVWTIKDQDPSRVKIYKGSQTEEC